ncbi:MULTISPECIES: TRAP transporter small permease [unclassified Chelatococcus]|uniref:TRAP transporter small permease n=1 Tax=unclassified Chelatococcus TaxID=2638111 RepID=UPI001BCF860B|nr:MULTISPECIES: TRAP transporter small permease [unclassified Chelatococcus]MBS7700349.1 TRAP transporter small permease [Chelatococcus sp. YT9]MBX3556145.1 TRAP transporter small permease [Chelatococcus sp.]
MSADGSGRRFDPARLLTIGGALALAVMLFWTMLDIGGRLLFSHPIQGTLDLVEVALVLVAFLALPECFRRDEQIKVDVFDAMLGPRRLRLLILIGEVATLAFLALLASTLLQPLSDAYRFGDQKPDLPVPIWTLLLTIEIALIVSILVVLRRVGSQIRNVLRQPGDETPVSSPQRHEEATP